MRKIGVALLTIPANGSLPSGPARMQGIAKAAVIGTKMGHLEGGGVRLSNCIAEVLMQFMRIELILRQHTVAEDGAIGPTKTPRWPESISHWKMAWSRF